MAIAVLVAGTWLATPRASNRVGSENYRVTANNLIAQGKITEALIEINRAIDADPTNGGPFLFRARLYSELGARDRAQSDFSTALKLGIDSRSP